MKRYRIAEARKARGWSQQELAEKLGTTQQVISRYENGIREPKAGVVAAMSSVLGVSISCLLGLDFEGSDEDESDVAHMIPVVGRAYAGSAREAIEQTGRFHPLPHRLYMGNEDSVWVEVSGNSMSRLFPDGALVLVNRRASVRSGDVAAVYVGSNDVTIKRVRFEEGAIRLCPESFDPEYRDLVVAEHDASAPEICFMGKVVTYTAPLNWRP